MKKTLKILGYILFSLIILLASGIGYLTLKEYKPNSIENIFVKNKFSRNF